MFDITAGSLNSLWDFKKKKVPTTIEIEHALSLTDFSRVSWGNGMLSIPMGMSIDFGGVIKEYAADSLAVLSKKLGVEYGLINLGGDIAVVGRKPDGSPWNVGITDPRNTDAEIATIEVHSGGLATGKDYKRYFVHEVEVEILRLVFHVLVSVLLASQQICARLRALLPLLQC